MTNIARCIKCKEYDCICNLIPLFVVNKEGMICSINYYHKVCSSPLMFA